MKRRTKTPDAAMMGPDPSVLGPRWKYSQINMTKAFSWFTYYHEPKEGIEWVLTYLSNNNYTPDQIKAFKSAKAEQIPMWVCTLAKMKNGGCLFPKEWDTRLALRIAEIIDSASTPPPLPAHVVSFPKEVATITLVDELLDQFYQSKYKGAVPDLYNILSEKKYRTTESSIAADYYTALLKEVKDDLEGYDHLNARNKKAYINFLEKIINDLRLYAKNLRKAAKTRKPRAKKLKSAEQLVSNVKFLVEDKELKIVSEAPSAIVGANVVWLWNPKNRILSYLQAEPNSQLSVKGMTIIGYDKKISKTKKIRKPSMIPEMLNSGKVTMLKDFNKLKTTDTPATGRISKDVMIVRVIK
jgi:hypothetical protein